MHIMEYCAEKPGRKEILRHSTTDVKLKNSRLSEIKLPANGYILHSFMYVTCPEKANLQREIK